MIYLTSRMGARDDSENIKGFRYIKTAGALYNMPGCAQRNKWSNITSEGEKIGSPLFISLPYVPKNGIAKSISAMTHSMVKAVQSKNYSLRFVARAYKERIKEKEEILIPVSLHWTFYKNCFLENYSTTATYPENKFTVPMKVKSTMSLHEKKLLYISNIIKKRKS